MTDSPNTRLYIAHVQEPDGNVVDVIIGSDPGNPPEEVRGRFEQFIQDTQEPGHVIVGFHELEPEPNPMPRIEWPSAIVAMIIKGLAAVSMILFLMHYINDLLNRESD